MKVIDLIRELLEIVMENPDAEILGDEYHDNLVPNIDIGRTKDGEIFLAGWVPTVDNEDYTPTFTDCSGVVTTGSVVIGNGKEYYAESPTDDPVGPPSGPLYVHRGGSWDLDPVHCRSAARCRNFIHRIDGRLGFRVARVAAREGPPADN